MEIIHTNIKITAGDIVRKLILSWLFAATVQYVSLSGEIKPLYELSGIVDMKLDRSLVIIAFATVLLTILSRFFNTVKAERIGILALFTMLAASTLFYSFTPAYLTACAGVFFLLGIYAVKGANTGDEAAHSTERCSKRHVITAVILCSLFFILVSAWGVCRVYSFSTPTFDFGIFSQMFHTMKTDGVPVTTLERDGPLSHFNVHVSPIYYLMLPFYAVFPYPVTLQILQAAVITSSVIPLWLIAKRHGLSPTERTLMCAIMLLFPALAGGVGYDLHENCFLAPLILWLLYAVDTENIVLTAVSALLTLSVKEDAAVYVAVIALWLTVSSAVKRCTDKKAKLRGLITGVSLFVLSIIWFLAVTSYLSRVGDGVMTYRYKNFMYDGSDSLVTVVKAVILSPMKAVYECVDSEKLEFIALTLVPVLVLPFFTRKYERFILLIPYVLINLMSDYQYQHDIFFQYTFASTAFLIYLTCVNIADIRSCNRHKRVRITVLTAVLAVSAVMFSVTVLPKAETYIDRYCNNREHYDSISECLKEIPDGASVAATTYYTVPLSKRNTLYDIKHSSKGHVLSCEYTILGVSDVSAYQKYETRTSDGYEAFCSLLTDEGYEPIGGINGVVVIYRKISE